MPLTVTITPVTIGQDTDSSPTRAWTSGTVTVQGNLQPANSREAVQYSMLNAVTAYDLYIAPTDTGGSAISFTQTQWKDAHVTANGLTYRVVGAPMDPITNGCLSHVILERNDLGIG